MQSCLRHTNRPAPGGKNQLFPGVFLFLLGVVLVCSCLAVEAQPAQNSKDVLAEFNLARGFSTRRYTTGVRKLRFPLWYPNSDSAPAQYKNCRAATRDVKDRGARTSISTGVTVWEFPSVADAKEALEFIQFGDQCKTAASYRHSNAQQTRKEFRQSMESPCEEIAGSFRKPEDTWSLHTQAESYHPKYVVLTLDKQDLGESVKFRSVSRYLTRLTEHKSIYVGMVTRKQEKEYRNRGIRISGRTGEAADRYCWRHTTKYRPLEAVSFEWQQDYFGRTGNCIVSISLLRRSDPQVIINSYEGAFRTHVICERKVSVPGQWPSIKRKFFEICGGKDVPEEGVQISLRYAADAYVPEEFTLDSGELTPSLIKVLGTVIDKDGGPIAGATVTLEELTATAATDSEGRYALNVPTEGSEPWIIHKDVALERNIEGLQCSIETPKPLVANGQRYTMILTITADGEPLANRQIRLSMPQRWRKNGREVSYLRTSSLLTGYKRDWTTDDNGTVVFDGFAAPVTLSKRLGVLQAKADLLYFPLQGELVVTDLPTSEFCKATYTLISPYPQVVKFRLMEVDAGTWQGKGGSELVISDPDSNRFTVEIKLAGRLKIHGENGFWRNCLYHTFTGKRFLFNYEPPQWGQDLNKQPGDLWKEFGMFNLQLAGKYAVDLGGALMLKSVTAETMPMSTGTHGPGAAAKGTDAYKKILEIRTEETGELYDIAKSQWSMIETGDKADQLWSDLNSLSHRKQVGRGDIEEKTIQTTDMLIGVVEIVPGLADKALRTGQKIEDVAMGVSKVNVPLELLKVTYENAKFLHKLHRQFEDVANAYQDTLLVPVVAFVEDNDGHKVVAVRSVAVRLWKKEQE